MRDQSPSAARRNESLNFHLILKQNAPRKQISMERDIESLHVVTRDIFIGDRECDDQQKCDQSISDGPGKRKIEILQSH